MRMRWIGIAVLVLALGIASVSRADTPADRNRLEGRWTAVVAERNGGVAADLVGHELTFTGDRFRITQGGRLLFGGTYALDASTEPRRITFEQTEGAEMRGRWLGIYRFLGDRLEIVDNAPDMTKPVPTAFAAGPGSGYVLVRFERR
jgi:uncharacterized protein (TIGR03067 family)